MNQAVEKYLTPKELSAVLGDRYGIFLCVERIRRIRRASIHRGEKLFVAGMARASEVAARMEEDKTFHLDTRERRKASACP